MNYRYYTHPQSFNLVYWKIFIINKEKQMNLNKTKTNYY